MAKKKTIPENLQQQNEDLKAELQAISDAVNEINELPGVEMPTDRKFMVDKTEYIFAPVPVVWWNGQKVKVVDALKDGNMLADMAGAAFALISKVSK